MKLYMMVLLTAFIAQPAFAQEPEIPTAPAGSLDLNGDGKVDKEETAKAVDSDATVGEVVVGARELVDAYGDVKDAKTAKLMAVAGLLAALFKLLLSLVKVLSKNVSYFSSKQGKRVVKYSTLGLGALAGLAANLAFGVSVIESVLIFGSGPLAIAIHEYTKDSKDADQAAE